jgi:hypothetical protein
MKQPCTPILLTFLLFLSLAPAVAGDEPRFQIRAGGGFAVYGTRTTFSYSLANGLKFTSTDTDAAATLHVPVDLRYAFSKRFNAGLDLKFGSYLYEPDSAEGKSNGFAVIGLTAEYSLIARDQFRWYVSLGFNTARLQLRETNSLTDVQTEADYAGGGYRIASGTLIFLSERLGLNIHLGIDSHRFDLDAFRIDGQAQNLNGFSGTLETGGLDGGIGLIVRL